MADRIAAFDWSTTPAGPMSDWPVALRTAVQLLVNSRFPMFVWWGPELTNIYNDAYAVILGRKHPALGLPAAKVWGEIWDIVGAQADLVIREQKATWNEEVLLVMDRYGYAEETYFTWSYSPILDEKQEAAGLFCACTEDTATVIGRRRLRTLRELAAETADLRTAEDALRAATDVLTRNPFDIPFALLYETDEHARRSRLVGSVGVTTPDRGIPEEIGSDGPWQLDLAVTDVRLLTDMRSAFDHPPQGPWTHTPTDALAIPLGAPGGGKPAGILIAGISRYRPLDDDYRGFLNLVAGHIATGIANARTYEAERRRAEALAELDRAKTLFFSNVSHEFRTPLTLMLGPLEDLLRSADLRAEHREQIDLIHRNGLRLLKLVNTLLDFSRIEAGRTQARLEPADLAAITSDLADAFRSTFERAGLTLTIDCPPLSQPVYVDREMWEKIVFNLLSNALKFTLNGGVTVRLRENTESVELSVEDTGIGIGEHDLPHVFERFHRGQGAHGRTHEGTGIGLALVDELAKLHGGRVSVTSQVQAGSAFTVSLPLGERASASSASEVPRGTALSASTFIEEAVRWLHDRPAEPADKSSPAEHARPHILIADDNTDMREYLSHLLSEEFRVTSAANGREAMAAALADAPDLILTDVMMPMLDGFGLVAAVRSCPNLKNTPVIMLSARSGEDAVVEGLDAGADDYLMKPFTARELQARINAHLALRTERQRAHNRLIQVFEQAPVGILVVRGPEFVVELANPTYQALLRGREVVGQKFADVVPELGQEVWDILRKVLTTGESFNATEFYIPYDADGDGAVEDHWFNLNYVPIQESNGSVSGIIAVLTEVTAQLLARKELERVNKELEEFAYVASHDLQEPLRMVNIYTQLLLRLPELQGDERAVQYSAFVHSGVQRMEQLIHDLLIYSRVVHLDNEQPRVADLNSALADALNVLRMRVEETDAVITNDPLPRVVADEGQLALVFQNLLSNSLKYRRTDTPPQVHISVRHQDENYVVAVRDNGIGFAPAYAERIFGLFKRLHKDAYPGTGLGLAICRRVVERYNGRIWAESEGNGRGATVYLCLRALPA